MFPQSSCTDPQSHTKLELQPACGLRFKKRLRVSDKLHNVDLLQKLPGRDHLESDIQVKLEDRGKSQGRSTFPELRYE